MPPDVRTDDTLYVVDRNLDVVHRNEGWAGFAKANRGESLLDDAWNTRLLDHMSGGQRERWTHIYEMLLDGRLPYHQEPLICSSPSEKRIYRLRITPARDPAGHLAWLVHHAVRIDDEPTPPPGAGRLRSHLDDPHELRRVFRERILHRRVRLPRYRVASHFQPLDEIGGDLIWHRVHPSGASDLVHADVMGHGEEAGRVAAQLAILLDDLVLLELGPAATVAKLNRAMLGIVPSDDVVFATGLVFRFDPDRRSITCCSFGHTGPIFSRAGPLGLAIGLPVGLDEGERPWSERQLDLDEHGTRFLIFSDGITEQFNGEGEMFGIEGLQRAFQEHLSQPLDSMLEHIIQTLDGFRGGALVKDDQTLLALDFVGP